MKMKVETGLVKYAALLVRTGKKTPEEAKLLVQSIGRNSEPRQGQKWVDLAETDWDKLFAEADQLRRDDRAAGKEREKTRRGRTTMAGFVGTVAMVAGASIVVIIGNVASLPVLIVAGSAFAVGGLVSMSAIVNELSATFKKTDKEILAELKTLNETYGDF
ncbi:hypothetical protein O6H91_12G068000 [Diphasiastrum complanatum]|uniref:Uncharacterized protein n=1 Tax=Diphasiastrum complanatum TaxID=34168 RepID=A0ACC2C433_DIPCM|nr:hypothetical protein O6H91_Y378700 [Diphasiastrum complanatum]KAJ7536402.1 hypothetical protein O6H91_12G068000 [Diphasiastrum complanatum]